MMRSKLAIIALLAGLFASSISAQTFLQEDWSSASGTTPPAGWSSLVSNGTSPFWRWDNPGGRAFDSAFTAPFAICDPDNFGGSASGVSTLRSPAMNLSGTALVNLSYDTQFRALQSATDYAQTEVWDGSAWNVVANFTANVGYLAPNADTTAAQLFDITAASGGSANAQLRFAYSYGYDWWWAIDNVAVSQPLPIDLQVVSIDAPTENTNSCLPTTGNLSVTITIRNDGSSTILTGNLVPLSYSLNGGTPVNEFLVLAADLLPNTTTQYTFATQANFPAVLPNMLSATVSYPGDADPVDDTASATYSFAGLPSATLPMVENFDSTTVNNTTVPPAGWTQDLTDGSGTDSDWYMHTGQTGSVNTGPLADHTTGSTGYYAYVEDSTGNFAQVNLLSPCLDLSLAVAPQCDFWMFSYNGNPSGPNVQENFMSVDVISYPGGVVTMDAFGPQGHFAGQAATWAGSNTNWVQQSVSLIPFAGQTIQLRFRGTSNNGGAGNTFYHDQAIDDVRVYDPQPTPGQAPRSGMAAFDINGALNVNGQAVASGSGGPYFANVTQGGAFTMNFDGVPGQPIAVVYGALNPVAATYPGGIGQFDIGGPGVDANGIPLGIAVFVNAIGWAQAGFPGLPIDAMFFTGAAGTLTINFTFPNFGIPSGSPLTTFQSAITDTVAPFVYISNAVSVTAF